MTEHIEPQGLDVCETEEAFRLSAILVHGLDGLQGTIKDGTYRERELEEDVFAFLEVANRLHTILGKAHCPEEEPGEALAVAKAV